MRYDINDTKLSSIPFSYTNAHINWFWKGPSSSDTTYLSDTKI